MKSVAATLCALCVSVEVAAQAPPRDLGESVSIIQLIANPDRYHGKVVSLNAYATVAFENNTLCMVAKPASSMDCVWLQYDDGPWETKADMSRFDRQRAKWLQYHGKPVFVRGTFNKSNTGHLSCCPGAIEKIADVFPHRSVQ